MNIKDFLSHNMTMISTFKHPILSALKIRFKVRNSFKLLAQIQGPIAYRVESNIISKTSIITDIIIRSLMRSRKREGPRMEPWQYPAIIGHP